MSSLIGKQAPDFTAQAVMPDNIIKEDFSLSDLKGKYVVLFFYPLDFTFVCPTEIIEFNRDLIRVRVPREQVSRSAQQLLSTFPVADLSIEEVDVGTIIEQIFTGQHAAAQIRGGEAEIEQQLERQLEATTVVTDPIPPGTAAASDDPATRAREADA